MPHMSGKVYSSPSRAVHYEIGPRWLRMLLFILRVVPFPYAALFALVM
jgi:hypothetical protein